MEENISLEKRKSIVESAIASFALEGEHPSSFVYDLLMKYANGEIGTVNELRRLIVEGENR